MKLHCTGYNTYLGFKKTIVCAGLMEVQENCWLKEIKLFPYQELNLGSEWKNWKFNLLDRKAPVHYKHCISSPVNRSKNFMSLFDIGAQKLYKGPYNELIIDLIVNGHVGDLDASRDSFRRNLSLVKHTCYCVLKKRVSIKKSSGID